MFLDFDKYKKENRTHILCGLATGVSTMCFVGNPVVCVLWLLSVAQRIPSYIAQTNLLLIICAVGAVGSLAASIVAKVLDKESHWPIVNIIYISIVTVIGGLLTAGFIALINEAAANI